MKLQTAITSFILIVLVTVFSGCNPAVTDDVSSNVPQITVSSESINEAGRLKAETLLDTTINNPVGSNQSPHVVWDAVDGAAYYAICMYDITASWLHWLALDLNETELEQGEYTSRDDYVGPYPPRDSGLHNYRIEVFALRQAVASVDINLNSKQVYADIEKALDRATSGGGNIIARGSVVGKHGN